jgi:hypothetical protein
VVNVSHLLINRPITINKNGRPFQWFFSFVFDIVICQWSFIIRIPKSEIWILISVLCRLSISALQDGFRSAPASAMSADFYDIREQRQGTPLKSAQPILQPTSLAVLCHLEVAPCFFSAICSQQL